MSLAHDLYTRVASRSTRWTCFSWYWGDAILIDGLLAGGAPDDVERHAVTQVEDWLHRCPPNFDDILAPGLSIVRLADRGDLDPAAVDRFLASLDRVPRLVGALPLMEPHRLGFRFGFCIDALYHLPPALAAYGVLRGDRARVDQAVDIMVQGAAVLECGPGWSQWYDHGVGGNNGWAWSRGIGWAVLGAMDLLPWIEDHPGLAQVQDLAGRMMLRLAETQEDDGNWRSLLDDGESMPETSTAAFYVASARHPACDGLVTLPEDVLAHAEDALVASIDDEGLATGVSADILPSFELAGYRRFPLEVSPWGQGGALRALAAMKGDG